uniref:Uncharacterized protein n=1 Tax=Kalanchoe fedtschenkoi TaxID=63787 RepID=A0A7N0V8V1_KALFE
MHRSTLLICSLLLLASFFPQGSGRGLGVGETETASYDDVAARVEVVGFISSSSFHHGINGWKREVIELDYEEPGANRNPRNGFLNSPPPSPPPPF